MRRIAGSVWAAWSPLCDLSQQSAVRTSPLFVVSTLCVLTWFARSHFAIFIATLHCCHLANGETPRQN